MNPMHHIVLSPHYDDAALSCGGLIAQLGVAGQQVTVATLFGGKPDYGHLSPFARQIHGRPLAGEDPIDQRRAEEWAALALLAAESRPGDYLDCIYRQDDTGQRWLYADEAALFGAVDPADDALVDELAHCLAALAPAPSRCTLYAPLAIGRHVDHQVARRSAARLQEHGFDVWCYEDYPYIARDPAGLAAALDDPALWRARLVPLSRADLQRKITAVLAYPSQLGVLFPGAGTIDRRVSEALERQAAQTGNGRPAERLWRMQAFEPSLHLSPSAV
jgi:LmbE family N-acetylglucosaminyl deacetylase